MPLPFGVNLSTRNIAKFCPGTSTPISGADGRYGYQGSEADDEIKGSGNSYTTEFRQLDPRLGRWLSLDPEFDESNSPYNSMDNNPIFSNDVDGLYTARRAEKMREKALKKGYEVGDVYQTEGGGKRDFGFAVMKENSEGTGLYSAHKFKGLGMNVMNENNFESYDEPNEPDNEPEKKQYGLTWKTPVGATLEGLGSNIIPTREKTKGATKGTSIASSYLSKKFPQQLNKTHPKTWKAISPLIPKKLLGLPLKSPVAGRMFGRTVPIVGRTLLIFDFVDAALYSMESIRSLLQDPPEVYFKNARKNVTSIGMYHEDGQTRLGL